jgi:sugar phosphate isomerase/epimerase
MIGIKLQLGWPQHEATRQLYSDRNPLAILRARGIGAVELPIVASSTDEVIDESVGRLLQEEMRPSFHPYSEGSDSNPAHFVAGQDEACRALHERVYIAADRVSRTIQHPVIVNIHPAAGSDDDDRTALFERSVEFFHWTVDYCRQVTPGAQPVAELQGPPMPEERVQRIGDNYGELLELSEQSGVELCWDFGHALIAHRQRGEPLDPPEAFLRRVAHVHCHDFDEVDHKPLLHGVVPWRRFLELLGGVGFDGDVILEVGSEEFLTTSGLESLDASLAALRSVSDE